MKYTINCPVCNLEDALEVQIFNSVYGADIDGNRGMLVEEQDIQLQGCECNLDDVDFTDLIDDAR